MSSDEEAAIIGRMVLERKELAKRETVLVEEVKRFSTQFSQVGGFLLNVSSGMEESRKVDDSDAARALLNIDKVNELLSDLDAVRNRLGELKKNLEKIY